MDDQNKNLLTYGDYYEDNSEDLRLVSVMKRIKDCPVMKYGTKKIKMSFFYCSCDPNQKDPICEACAFQCHAGHKLSPRYDYDQTKIKQICMCGSRCHQLGDGGNVNEKNTYQPFCYFNELGLYSKGPNFLENTENKNVICLFCGVFCLNDEKNWLGQSTDYVKKFADNESIIPACQCPSQSHKDQKQVLGYTFRICDPSNFIMEGLTPVHYINMLFKSDKSFKNLFSSFLNDLDDFESKIRSLDFEFDKRMNVSIFYFIISHLANMTDNIHEFYYFDSKIIELISPTLVCNLIKRKIPDHPIIFTFVSSLLKSFSKFTISSSLEFLPKFKIMDYCNLSPFHRLQYAYEIENNGYFIDLFREGSKDLVIVDRYIESFENLIRQRFDKEEGFNLILSITSLLKKFSKFYLVSYDQIIKFSSLIDDMFYYITSFNKKLEKKNSNDLNHKMTEIKIVSNITKIFIYFSLYYNDRIFQAYLNKPAEEEAKVSFLHYYNELGKLLTKNLVHLMNYLREELDKIKKNKAGESKNDIDKEDLELELTELDAAIDEDDDLISSKIKKVLQLTQNLLSIFMHTDDAYLLTLKRNMNSNFEMNLRMLNNVFTEKENQFLDFIDDQTCMIEDKLQDYFNFKCHFEELSKLVLKTSLGFFKFMDMRDYKHPSLPNDNELSMEFVNIASGERSKSRLMSSDRARTRIVVQKDIKWGKNKDPGSSLQDAPYSILLSKSTFIFSLLKIFKIQHEEAKLTVDLVDSILRNLFFFMDNQPDNCLLILSKPCLEALLSLPARYSEKALDLMITCLKVIIKNNYKFNHVYTVKDIAIKLSYKAFGHDNMYQCLLRMIKILKMILPISTLIKNETLGTIRKSVKKIFRDYKIFSNYKNYLTTLSEFFRLNENKTDDEKDFANNEIYDVYFRNENLTPTVAFKTYLKYLSLVNLLFDDGALLDQSDFLNSILNTKEVILILRLKNLDLQLRTEMLRFFRMVNIDLAINKKKLKEYRKAFTRNFELIGNNETLMSTDDIKVTTFLENLVLISGVNLDSPKAIDEYEVLLFELQNIEEIMELSKSSEDIKLSRNYFENGIFLPLKVFFNKIFAIVLSMTGKEILKIYTLCYYLLVVKKFVIKHNYYETNDNKEKKDDPFTEVKKESKKKSVFNFDKLSSDEIIDLEKDIEKITDQSFKALNYVVLLELVNKHLLSMIENPSSNDLAEYFEDYESHHEKEVEKFNEYLEKKNLLEVPVIKRSFELVEIYTTQKNDFENSCMKINLTEIHSDEEVPYRNLLVHFLLFLTTEAGKIFGENIYFRESIEILLHYLIVDTVDTQTAVIELQEKDESFVDLSFFAEVGFKNLLSIFFRLFNPTRLDIGDDYNLTCHIIKIFKFLCEEHNNHFQQIFLRQLDFKIGEVQRVYFYDMMIFALDKILLLSGWDKISRKDEREDIDYFYALYSCLIEMLIEIVQGTNKDNFNLLLKEDGHNIMEKNKDEEKSENKKEVKGLHLMKAMILYKNDPVYECGKALPLLLNNIKSLLFNDQASQETIYKSRKELVCYMLAYMEEYACPSRIKFLIMNSFNPRSILKSICISLKTYYFNQLENQVQVEEDKKGQAQLYTLSTLKKDKLTNRSDRSNPQVLKPMKTQNTTKNSKRLIFSEMLYNYFSDLYFTDEEFNSSAEFEFCSSFYNYFKLTVLQYKFEESINFWEKMKSISEDDLYEFNRKTKGNEISPEDSKDKAYADELDLELYYVIKFFEQVSKSVTIQLEGVKEAVLVVYTMTPLLKYLSLNSKDKFLKTVNRDNRYSKLYALMQETIYFKLEVEYNWNSTRTSKLRQKAMQFDYLSIGLVFYLIVVVINIILLATLRNEGQSAAGSDAILLVIRDFSFVFAAVDLVFIIIWCITKLPLNYTIEKEKFVEKIKIDGKSEEDITFFDKYHILVDNAILGRGEINTFIWLFIFILIAATSDKLLFLYSIALISIMFLSTTLNNIVLSIVLKKGQLAWTGIFTLIVLYFYSSWAFFYVQDRYVDTLHRDNGAEYTCQTLLNCWLYTTNEGFRWKAGIGKVLQNMSLFKNPANYLINRFFFDFTFFTVVVIVLKKVLFGIILDTFRELRKKQFKTDTDIANICFICEVEKDECEKNNISFKEHCEKEHNVWEYVNYMITLRLTDAQDMNATNSYCKEQLEAKNITWLPVKETSKEDEEESEEE